MTSSILYKRGEMKVYFQGIKGKGADSDKLIMMLYDE